MTLGHVYPEQRSLRHDNLDLTPEFLAPPSLPGHFGQQEPLSVLVMDGFSGREAFRQKVSQGESKASGKSKIDPEQQQLVANKVCGSQLQRAVTLGRLHPFLQPVVCLESFFSCPGICWLSGFPTLHLNHQELEIKQTAANVSLVCQEAEVLRDCPHGGTATTDTAPARGHTSGYS